MYIRIFFELLNVEHTIDKLNINRLMRKTNLSISLILSYKSHINSSVTIRMQDSKTATMRFRRFPALFRRLLPTAIVGVGTMEGSTVSINGVMLSTGTTVPTTIYAILAFRIGISFSQVHTDGGIKIKAQHCQGT